MGRPRHWRRRCRRTRGGWGSGSVGRGGSERGGGVRVAVTQGARGAFRIQMRTTSQIARCLMSAYICRSGVPRFAYRAGNKSTPVIVTDSVVDDSGNDIDYRPPAVQSSESDYDDIIPYDVAERAAALADGLQGSSGIQWCAPRRPQTPHRPPPPSPRAGSFRLTGWHHESMFLWCAHSCRLFARRRLRHYVTACEGHRQRMYLHEPECDGVKDTTGDL